MEDTGLIPVKDNHCSERGHSDEDVDFYKAKVNFVDSPKARWLHTFDSPLPPKPSLELTSFISACDVTTSTDMITTRANITLGAIFEAFGVGHRGRWAERRKHEALILYYRVLLAICKAEAQTTNLASLLKNERFHRSMFVCSSELVLVAHDTATMLFLTSVFERIGISGFDLFKVIESFVKFEKRLPRDLRRHLNSLEERLLESFAWEKRSSLYNSLALVRPDLLGKIERLSLFAEPMPSLDSIASRNLCTMLSSSNGRESSPDPSIHTPKKMRIEYRGSNTDTPKSVLVDRNSFTTPKKHRLRPLSFKPKLPQPTLQFEIARKSNHSVGGETCAAVEIEVFFSKILKLAAVRIKAMVERLKLPEKMIESIYCLFQIALRKGTNLFFNRHIDQIILCCFYMVANMVERSPTFTELISNYIKQPQYTHHVYSSVFVDHSADCYGQKTGHEHVSLSKFHHDNFVPVIKPLLMELSPGTTKYSLVEALIKCLGSPNMSPFPNIPDMSPKKVSAAHNVFVSPLRSSKMEAFISSSWKSSYAFVGENTREFQSPSKDLTVINSRLNSRKPRGRLNFDDLDKAIFISDSTVTKCLFLQDKSLKSSADPIQEN